MLRTLPPTAAPVYFKDLLRGVASTLNGGDGLSSFSGLVRDYFRVKHAFLVSSGKAALYLSLKTMEQTSSRREVILPAYASFCLASAVAKTGLPVKLADIDPATLDFDWDHLERLVDNRTLAVIPVHNYGLVNELDRIQRIARERGAYLMEDAAQGAGAQWENQKAGALGDAGIISLGRGKNICTLGGGVILTDRDDLASALQVTIQKLPKPAFSKPLKSFFTGLGLSFFLNPNRYGIPARLPFLNLGANIYDPGFEVGPMSPFNAAVGQETFSRLDQLNQTRAQKAETLKTNLKKNRKISIPKTHDGAESVYLRFPVIFASPQDRLKALNLLVEKGLGANPSYPTPLDKLEGFKRYIVNKGEDLPGARYLADRILTLPTHIYVTSSDLDQMVGIINKLA